MPKRDDPLKAKDFYDRARRQFSTAKDASREIREKAEFDLKMVHGDQWDPLVRTTREQGDNPKPVLSFNREQDMVQYVSNQVRQNKPTAHVTPVGEGASEDTAKVIEGIFRHIDYISQADIARDHSVECSTSCSFGYYRITTEYVDDKSFDQEPRIKRILDQFSVYVDPASVEPDYSDADYFFVRKKMKWEDYQREFPNAQRSSFEVGDTNGSVDDWQNDKYIWIAEYWWVEKKQQTLLQLSDGTIDFESNIRKQRSTIGKNGEMVPGEIYEDEVLNERDVTERLVHFDLINGVESLEQTRWIGKWIPIIPVLGRESVVDGKRILESLVRFIHDAQKLLNIYKSSIAEACGSSLRAQLLGYKGQFKGWHNKNNRDKMVLEVEPIDIAGKPAPLPQPFRNEPPIAALTQGALMAADDMKAGANIYDSSTGAAKAEYSGISVEKRINQADIVNFHFMDNLTRAVWLEGQIKLDLIPKLIDTPRAQRILGEDGKLTTVMIATALGQDDPQHPDMPPGWRGVQGMEHMPHHRLDQGTYNLTVTTGPTYANRFKQNFEMISSLVKGNPMFWQLYGDLFFKNWQDLPANEEFANRARMGLLPAVQQQLDGAQGMVPVAQLQAVQAQLQGVVQKLKETLFKEKTEVLKLQSQEKMKLMDNATKIIVADRSAKRDEGIAELDARMQMIDTMWERLHESELGGDMHPAGQEPAPVGPDGQPMPPPGAQPQPQAQGAPQ